MNNRKNSLMRGWVDAAISAKRFSGVAYMTQLLRDLNVPEDVIIRTMK